MANEYTCSTCGRDGTRCDCHRQRQCQRPDHQEDLRRRKRVIEREWEELGVRFRFDLDLDNG